MGKSLMIKRINLTDFVFHSTQKKWITQSSIFPPQYYKKGNINYTAKQGKSPNKIMICIQYLTIFSKFREINVPMRIKTIGELFPSGNIESS